MLLLILSTSSPNQPPEDLEPNQPPPIQVPRPLSQLRNQSIILSKPRPSLSRPAPGLIPVQTYTRSSPGHSSQNISGGLTGQEETHLNSGQGVYNVQGLADSPGTVSQSLISEHGQSVVQSLSSTPTLLLPKQPLSQASVNSPKPILNIPSRAAVRMSSTFTPNIHQQEGMEGAMSMVPIEEQDVPVLSLPEPQEGLLLLAGAHGG